MGFTPSVGLNMGFTPSVVYPFGLYPICGLFGGLYPHPWFVWRALSPSVVWLKGFTPTVFWFISRDVTPIKNTECLYCDVGLLPFWTCPIFSQRSYHYTILWVSYMFIHSYIYGMHTDIIHTWLHCQSYFVNCTESVIHNVSNSEMLPIKCISSGRSHQNSRLPMPFHFPSVVITPLR